MTDDIFPKFLKNKLTNKKTIKNRHTNNGYSFFSFLLNNLNHNKKRAIMPTNEAIQYIGDEGKENTLEDIEVETPINKQRINETAKILFESE